ncbi:MAG: ATP-grasp domain-containing protein [Lactobacillaceae bacterium]|jgi:acetyl/propionyl-CoA carboxylase alpha subunit|nr:ATP-grasp domain-containing protein [Lactobacillaceae bacterium]
MFTKILIANRGEIANRIKKTADDLNIQAVFFESQNPRDYYDASKIIDFALQNGVDAIHPGYGFLSENAEFVQLVESAGLKFIGPHSSFIELFGNKANSRQMTLRRNVKTIPEPVKDEYPRVIKFNDGAGGRGTQVIDEPLDNLVAGTFYYEKFLPRIRHIEAQVFSDGKIIHILGYRDGSIQLRQQKMIEMTAVVSGIVESQILEAIQQMSDEFNGYVGVATIEFVLDLDSNNVYFMEVNPRIQVEHAVTELTSSIDIVELQLKLADGQSISIEPSNQGFAIEARILAIDSETKLPNAGLIEDVVLPTTVRIDNGFLSPNTEVSPFFDPLLAKFISYGLNFEQTRQKLVSALEETKITGIKTNVDLLKKILTSEDFMNDKLDTNFLTDHFG